MATVFTLAGAFGPENSPDNYLTEALEGTITNGNTVVPIDYDNDTIFEAQVDQGAQLLNEAILSTSGPRVAFGHSLGAVVCCNWLLNYGPTSTVSPETLSFVLIGNSVRAYGGLCYAIGYFPHSRCPSNTPYTVMDFVRQYDGWADIPANAFSVAGINQVAGANLIHPNYQNVSLTESGNVSVKAGNVTYMWSLTYPVPLLGTSTTGVASMDEELRPQIEASYLRPVKIPPPDYSLHG